MLEFPEAKTISRQLQETVVGKTIKDIVLGQSEHKFAFFSGDEAFYKKHLVGKKVTGSEAYGPFVDIQFGELLLLLGDGVNIRYYEDAEKLPKKHQLLLVFDDDTFLVGSIQMYGGMWLYLDDNIDSIYYMAAKQKPSPLSDDFNLTYFKNLMATSKQTLSAKAFLATEQRIPGLGNGVLQDILFNAKIHPKRKIKDLSENEVEALFVAVKNTLEKMTTQGGRNIEKDLFSNPGQYKTQLSAKTKGQPCPECSGEIIAETYLGGKIYYCSGCQKMV